MANAVFGALLFFYLQWVLLIPFELIWPVERIPWTERFNGIKIVTAILIVNGLLSHYIGPIDSIFPFRTVPLWVRTPFERLPCSRLSFTILVLFGHDFVYYWLHRVQHEVGWLWPLHSLHHVDRHLSALTLEWSHPLGSRPMILVEFAIMLFMLGPIEAIHPSGGFDAVAAAFVWTHHLFLNLFIHANWKIPFGPFTRIICGPQVHRIHHSIEPNHINKNYAMTFPVIDIVFGTYCHPKKDEWPKTGISGVPAPRGALDAFWMPVRDWKSYFASVRSSRAERRAELNRMSG